MDMAHQPIQWNLFLSFIFFTEPVGNMLMLKTDCFDVNIVEWILLKGTFQYSVATKLPYRFPRPLPSIWSSYIVIIHSFRPLVYV